MAEGRTRRPRTGEARLAATGEARLAATGEARLAATGEARLAATGAARRAATGAARRAAYLDGIAAVLGHASRAASARAYCTGLLLPGERRSIEPMAARIDPGRVQAAHRSLHHVVAKAEWDDAAMLAAVREQVLPAIARHGPIRYWIVLETQ